MKKMWTMVLLMLAWNLVFTGTTAAGPVLDRVQKKGELVVGMSGDQPPLNATTRDGKIIGLEADIASRLSSDMGVKLRLATMPFAELLPALGLAPQPVVVSNALRNVPERGWWGWDDRWTLPYHPETWYLTAAASGAR